jgi:hypothetical protein
MPTKIFSKVLQLFGLTSIYSRREAEFQKRDEKLKASYAARDNTPVDIHGKNNLELIKQMSPDDWHEIFSHWNWHNRPRGILHWAISNPRLDRATAVHIFFNGDPVGFVSSDSKYGNDLQFQQHLRFLATLSDKLRTGFYPSHNLKLAITSRDRATWETKLKALIELNNPIYSVPNDVLNDNEKSIHSPKYEWNEQNDEIVYEYKYWLKNIAS